VKPNRRVAILLVVLFTLVQPPIASASIFGVIPDPFDIARAGLLAKILNEYTKIGQSDGLKSIMTKMHDIYDSRAVGDIVKTFRRIKADLAVANDIRNEVHALSCDWSFNVHDPFEPFRGLLDKRGWVCKKDMYRRNGTDTMVVNVGGNGVSVSLPGSDINELVNYVGAMTHNQTSGLVEASDQSWGGLAKSLFTGIALTRRSPGEAARDGAVANAELQDILATHLQLTATHSLIQQLDLSTTTREERHEGMVAAWIAFGAIPPSTSVPGRTGPPPGGPKVDLGPADLPTEPAGGAGNGADNGSNDPNACNPVFRDNIAFGDVMDAEAAWKGQHPTWYKPNGTGQDLVDSEHWDDYYAGVVANLNKTGHLIARIDPCDCGEIQVKPKGDNSISDQYHILTSWGQIRADQNAYRETCYPAQF
jgi:hypothetical protein